MILNSNGKLFGKISIVDLLVIVLVIVAIVGSYFRLSKSENIVTELKTTNFYYTITIKEIRESNKDHLVKSLKKEFCLNGDTEFSMGTLIDVDVKDATSILTLTDGSVVSAKIPEKYDVDLTFKIAGHENDDGYYTSDMQELCVGKGYSISSIYCSVYGIIDKIWE